MLFMVAVLMMTVQDTTTESFTIEVGIRPDMIRLAAGDSIPELTLSVKAALIRDRFSTARDAKGIRSPSLRSSIVGMLTAASARFHVVGPLWNKVMDEKEGISSRGRKLKWESGRAIMPADTLGTWDKALQRMHERNAVLKSWMDR